MAEQDLPGPGQNSKDTNKQLTTAITATVWERFILWLLTFPWCIQRMPCASAASTQTLVVYEEVVQRILFLRRIESLLTEAGL